jgi:hypothetical protein
MAQGNGSFATFLILCSTSFFLGILFSSFSYDFPLLWTSTPPTPEFYNQLEAHLTLLNHAPQLIPRILHMVIGVGLIGFFVKLYNPTEANMLFDGASLLLYLSGLVMYGTNIVKGLRVVSTRDYFTEVVEGESSFLAPEELADAGSIGREDTMKVLAASNTILALVLLGVLVLQAGQWYAERKEAEEVQKFAEKDAKKASKPHGKKKSA